VTDRVAVAWLVAELLFGLTPVRATGEPKFTPSTTNCTAPVGATVEPPELSVTVAVKVTDWPKVDGFSDDCTVVIVAAAVTVWPPVSEPVLFEKSPSPLT
jgi:hypothetical protein